MPTPSESTRWLACRIDDSHSFDRPTVAIVRAGGELCTLKPFEVDIRRDSTTPFRGWLRVEAEAQPLAGRVLVKLPERSTCGELYVKVMFADLLVENKKHDLVEAEDDEDDA